MLGEWGRPRCAPPNPTQAHGEDQVGAERRPPCPLLAKIEGAGAWGLRTATHSGHILDGGLTVFA